MKTNTKNELGWLSPDGKLYKAKWGDHEEIATDIIRENHWYEEWMNSDYASHRDFLNKSKNYVLINDPSMTEMIITTGGRLTKAQKEYLYDLYIRTGQKKKAKAILDE